MPDDRHEASHGHGTAGNVLNGHVRTLRTGRLQPARPPSSLDGPRHRGVIPNIRRPGWQCRLFACKIGHNPQIPAFPAHFLYLQDASALQFLNAPSRDSQFSPERSCAMEIGLSSFSQIFRGSSDLEERERGEPGADDRLRRAAEPVGQEGGVDPAEVGVVLQVAVVEVVEARVVADEAGLGDRSDDEQRRGGAVVGPVRGVLRDPAAELAEGQQRDAVGLAGGGQVVVERGDRIGELGQERRVGAELVGVGVEAVERGVEDPGAEAGLDDLGDQLEPARQAEIRVLRAAGLRLGDLLEPAARLVGRQRAAADEARAAGRRSRRSSRASWSRASRSALRSRSRAGELEPVLLEALERGDLGLLRARSASGSDRLPMCKRRRVVARLRGPCASRARPSQPVSRTARRSPAGPSPRSPSSGSASGRGSG